MAKAGKAPAIPGPRGSPCPAADDRAGRRHDRRAHLCLGNRRSRPVQVVQGRGAHFGLTPKKYQSGETDVTGRISKIGDGGVRTALYEAANVITRQPTSF